MNKGVPQLSPGHYSHLGHQTLTVDWANGEPSLIAIIVTTIFLKAQHGLILKKWIFRSGFCQIFHSFAFFYFNAESPVDCALIFMQCQLPAITEPGAGDWGPGDPRQPQHSTFARRRIIHEGSKHNYRGSSSHVPVCRVELETKVAEDYSKIYNHGEGTY